VVRVLGYRSRGTGSIPGTTRKKVVGLERGPLSLVSTTEELLGRKVAAPVYKTDNTAVGIRHADHVASYFRKKLAITSPTSGGRSVGIVRSWTQTMEFSFRDSINPIFLLESSYRFCAARLSSESPHSSFHLYNLLEPHSIPYKTNQTPEITSSFTASVSKVKNFRVPRNFAKLLAHGFRAEIPLQVSSSHAQSIIYLKIKQLLIPSSKDRKLVPFKLVISILVKSSILRR
jgi:hypothetical protein